MATPHTHWSRSQWQKRSVVVGGFFEMLARVLLRASRAVVGHEDLVIKSLGIGVEVKGGCADNHLRIPVPQLETHSAHTGDFPLFFEHFLYCLFCYNSRATTPGRRSGKRRSKLAGCRDPMAVYSVLAQCTKQVYILDYRVLQRIQEKCGTSSGLLPSAPDEATLALRRGLLQSFRQDCTYPYEVLGLEREAWTVRERTVHVDAEIGLFTHRMDLHVTEVLPTYLVKEFNKVIRLPESGGNATRRLKIVSA